MYIERGRLQVRTKDYSKYQNCWQQQSFEAGYDSVKEGWRSNVIGHLKQVMTPSRNNSVCRSVSRITYDRGSGRGPNMVVTGKG